MPEGLGKTGQTSYDTPQQQGDTQPDGAATIVRQEPRKQAGQRVEVVEHRPSDYLVGKASPAKAVLAHMQCLVEFNLRFWRELQNLQAFTMSFVVSEEGDRDFVMT